MLTNHLSEQEVIRRKKLAALQEMGVEAYPAATYPVNAMAATIKAGYKETENKDQFGDVTLAGRIMSIRDMGKASFAVIQDSSGRIQLYIKRDEICPGEDKTTGYGNILRISAISSG
jgi:lysyl-tRNA synthetase, class II